MAQYACDPERAQNSNHSVFLVFLFEISITCQKPENAHFFQFENPERAQNSNRFCLEFNFSSNFESFDVFLSSHRVPPVKFFPSGSLLPNGPVAVKMFIAYYFGFKNSTS